MNLLQHLKPTQTSARWTIWRQKTIRLLCLQKKQEISHHPTLQHLRNEIDQLDHEIITLFANRMQVAEAIGNYKKKQQLSPLQPARWAEVKALRISKACALGLSEVFIENMLELVHQESLRRQEDE